MASEVRDEFIDQIRRECVTFHDYHGERPAPVLPEHPFPISASAPPRPARWKGAIINITDDDAEETGKVRKVDGVCLVNPLDALAKDTLFQKFLPVSKAFSDYMCDPCGDGIANYHRFRSFWMRRGWIMQEAFSHQSRLILHMQKGSVPFARTWDGKQVRFSTDLNEQLLVKDAIMFEAATDPVGVLALVDVLVVGDMDKRWVPLHRRIQLLDALVSETPEMRFAKIARTASQKRELARQQQASDVLFRMCDGTAFLDDVPGNNVIVGANSFL